MRSALLALLLFASARPADACSIAPWLGDSRPQPGGDLAINGTIFIEAPYFATYPMQAFLYDPRAEAEIPLSTIAYGQDLIRVVLPELDPGVQYQARLALDIAQNAKTIAFTAIDRVDRSPPSLGSSLRLTAEEGTVGPCHDTNGWLVHADFEPASDDGPMAVYLLQEALQRDSPDDPIVRDAKLAPLDGSAPRLTAFFPEQGEHCFFVEAYDASGLSAVGTSIECVQLGVPQQKDPPFYGPPEELAGGDLLTEEATGCACSAREAGSSQLSALLLLLALAGSRSLRRK